MSCLHLLKRERRDALTRYAQLIKDRAEEIYWLEAVLTGKAKSFITFEVDAAVEAFICKYPSFYFHLMLRSNDKDICCQILLA